jgi:hypothetical protein
LQLEVNPSHLFVPKDTLYYFANRPTRVND